LRIGFLKLDNAGLGRRQLGLERGNLGRHCGVRLAELDEFRLAPGTPALLPRGIGEGGVGGSNSGGSRVRGTRSDPTKG
jgi:hypothetical protein